MKRVLRTLEFLTVTCVYLLCSFKNSHYNLHLCKLEFLVGQWVVLSNRKRVASSAGWCGPPVQQ